MFEFVGTQIHNLLPNNVNNMSLPMFKKYITHWLLYEYDAKKSIFMMYQNYNFLFLFHSWASTRVLNSVRPI